ncbi:unnamed protein product [Rotaria magnacalcarata]|uniref:FLYWCH-type domain-containing protein n=1 Tax=Rotaria magnacalcarata TaxID=392030 RepID=A0A816Y2Z9_9BILA|nr:unnamed protein product [Rotaria magnacalcarata]CAF4442654.1 unnamed protein product [Rotaria magnacalcarata]
MSQIEQLSSINGKPMILHEGYIYTVKCTTKTKSIFRCKNRDCKARAARTDELTSPIIHSTLRTYPLSDAGQLPKNEPLILMIQRQRTTETVETDGRLPEKLRKTYRDEGFILHEDKN